MNIRGQYYAYCYMYSIIALLYVTATTVAIESSSFDEEEVLTVRRNEFILPLWRFHQKAGPAAESQKAPELPLD